jgi:hypothetical protein
MSQFDANAINQLMGRFAELQERWESDPQNFDWGELHLLAQDGAHAYNEGAGPSFHALAIDGVQHSEFHEHFLSASLQAGFDAFKLVRAGNATTEIPVIDHATLAEAVEWNASSARMHASLMDLARRRFEAIVQEIEKENTPAPTWLSQIVFACGESIPADMLKRIAPGLEKRRVKKQTIDPVEGYLSMAEVIVDIKHAPYG